MFDRDSFISRISTTSTCPDGAIGVEVWGRGRDGTPNEALRRLAMNVDPQHGGGCWFAVNDRREDRAYRDLPPPISGWLGSAASAVLQDRAYRDAAARYPSAAIWCPRWDCDALVAAMGLCGFELPTMWMRLAQLDALDSSADASRIDAQLRDCAAQCWGVGEPHESQWLPYALAYGSAVRAETVTDTEWGAVQALIRAGDFGGAVDAAAALLVTGDLPVAYHSVAAAETVARWYAEREACAAYVAGHAVTLDGVAHVHGAPMGAWAFALADHDWAILSFNGRDGLAFSVAGSRRLPLEQRSAVIAEINKRLTALEGAGAHWAGAAGITGSRGRTTLSAADVVGALHRVTTRIGSEVGWLSPDALAIGYVGYVGYIVTKVVECEGESPCGLYATEAEAIAAAVALAVIDDDQVTSHDVTRWCGADGVRVWDSDRPYTEWG